MEQLYSGQDMRASLRLPQRDSAPETLFVTFSNFRATPSIEDDGFGQRFLHNMGLPALHIVTAGNTWFQSREIFELAQAVQQARAMFPRAVGYGSSMGGFGAMIFSDLFRLDTTLAISPQYSIQPHKVQGDSRWAHIATELEFVFDDMATALSKTAHHNLFYDPCTADNIHARLFQQNGVNCFALPHSGHSSAGFLQQVGVLSELVTQAAQDPMADFSALHSVALERSARSALYTENKAEAERS